MFQNNVCLDYKFIMGRQILILPATNVDLDEKECRAQNIILIPQKVWSNLKAKRKIYLT